MKRIKFSNHAGTIRIRFQYRGVKFNIQNLGHYSDSIALTKAEAICNRITLDIASGHFTATNNQEMLSSRT